MKISVVMTTYNGQKYIISQLDSLLHQTRQPDEVLIFDDKSSDDTVMIIRNYISLHHPDNWKLFVNDFNKGWKKNFIDGLIQSSGDVLFTCDQDDVWHPKKIELMSKVFDSEREALLVLCNYKRFTHSDTIKYDSVTEAYYKRHSNPHNAENLYPGCTFAFKRDFFISSSHSWIDDFPHDLLLYLSGWVYDKVYVCKAQLHYFRRHAESATSNSPPVLSYDKRIIWINNNLKVLNSLVTNAGKYSCKHSYKRIKWYRLRYELISKKKLANAFRLIMYFRHYRSCMTWLSDVFVSIKR